MTKSVFLIVMIVMLVLNLVVWSSCFFLSCKIKKQRTAKERLIRSHDDYEKSAKLHSDFRVVRHDFANYVQAAGAIYDETCFGEEGVQMLKQQKQKVRKLIADWTAQADGFLNKREGDL